MNSEKEAWKAFGIIFGVVVFVCILLEAIGLTAEWLRLVKIFSAVDFFVSVVAFFICEDEENKDE